MREFGAPVPYDATAIRPGWDALPTAVHRRVALELGGEPTEVAIAGGGFTAGFAARVRSRSGAEVFVKAAGPATPEVRAAYASEARSHAALPAAVHAPVLRFHECVEEWSVTGFEAVPGEPVRLPMSPGSLRLMLRAWAASAEALDPPPPLLVAAGVAPKTAENMRNFRAVAGGEAAPFALPPGLAGRWDELAELEDAIDRVMAAPQVTHGDLRPDNLVVGADRAWICDWSRPRFMPQWVDTVCLLSVAHGDGHDAERLFWGHPTAAGVTGEQLDTFLAAFTGALLRGWPDAPPGVVSPAIGEHMRWNGLAASDWLAGRRGWS